jgi:trans-resveratrol di-O-methyltransferase
MTNIIPEKLQAEAQLLCHAFGYLKTMALQCAIKLGIPSAIHRHGGAASLSELQATLPIAASKQRCIPRLMRYLAASGIFREESLDGDRRCYHLTAASRLLIVDDIVGSSGHTSLLQFILLCMSPLHLTAAQSLAEWLQNDDGAVPETPFKMAHGTSIYDPVIRHVEFGQCFNDAMTCDSRFVEEIIVRECSEVLASVTSLVDVGGGYGTMARAIAKEFPHIRCSVLELPDVLDTVPVDDDGTVELVPGDMI